MFRRIMLYFYTRGNNNAVANALQVDGKKNRIIFPYCGSTCSQESGRGRSIKQMFQQLFNHDGMGYITREWYIDDAYAYHHKVERLERNLKKLEQKYADFYKRHLLLLKKIKEGAGNED